MKHIFPSIFGLDLKAQNHWIKEIAESNEVDYFHFDLTEPESSADGFDGLESLDALRLLLEEIGIGADIHIISGSPIKYCKKIISKDYRMQLRVSMHADSKENPKDFALLAAENNILPGLAFKLAENPITKSADLNYFAFIHLIANDERAGLSEFQESVLFKAYELSTAYPSKPITLDCGVKAEHLKKGRGSGVTHFVMGSAVFKSINPLQTIIDFNKILE